MQDLTFLTTEELAKKIRYSARYIRRHLVDYKLHEGVHYTRPFGGKKMLFIWERIQEEMNVDQMSIPLASGGICHG
ncbi:hypothetical protein [Paraperlucidibaca baekdonensis]|jgi:hypothetical protein|uniref:Helix-turn-helix protein n=1 Tax=Paraperlucidibaca baekdonensis TaxID=748120 RepID=A0A3E0H6L8_9GAMM|nr:hypothetical protein [Paraperlucidibaca baekdonensis]REH39089.1 hypothetical protein DFR26_1268 [Paraperlucidibaca baekdonensis]|tara:strand:- start:7198 stop:7425 length:228 start_codon:yes stop_codon:yes gene_type:complete